MKAAAAVVTLSVFLMPVAQADLRIELQKKKQVTEQAGTVAPKVTPAELPGQEEKGQVTRVSMGCEESASDSQDAASPGTQTCVVEKSGEMARKARARAVAPVLRK